METEKPTRGFRGVRNTDTTAARAARQRNALERKLRAAQVLLTEHGYKISPPPTKP